MKITTQMITRSALILALTIAIQSLRLPQPVTGPLVNAMLFLAVDLIGMTSAILIGLCTPVIAFLFGIMLFAPAVPVIILGNVTLAVVYGLLVRRPLLGLSLAAVAKFGMMSLGVYFLLPTVFNLNIPSKVAATLTTPQLFTALGGAALAFLVVRGLKWLKN